MYLHIKDLHLQQTCSKTSQFSRDFGVCHFRFDLWWQVLVSHDASAFRVPAGGVAVQSISAGETAHCHHRSRSWMPGASDERIEVLKWYLKDDDSSHLHFADIFGSAFKTKESEGQVENHWESNETLKEVFQGGLKSALLYLEAHPNENRGMRYAAVNPRDWRASVWHLQCCLTGESANILDCLGQKCRERIRFLRRKRTASHRHEDLESSTNWKFHNF